MNIIDYTEKEKNFFDILIFLIAILPISLLLGSAIINILIIIIDLLFLYIFFKKKEFNLENKISFYILLIFWVSLLVNLIYSSDFVNSFSRCVGFIRFAILALAIQFFIENSSSKKMNKVFLTWSIIFFIVSFDLIFEFIMGFNLFGNTSYMPGRLTSFFEDELKIGHYYLAFNLLAISLVYYYFKNNTLLYFILFSTTFISLIIGERANFIKFTFMVIFFIYFFEKKNFYFKSILIFLMISFLSIFISINNTYKERFWTMFGDIIIEKKNISKMINFSPYGGHWHAAWEIFNENKIFGVGLKNFRKVSGEQKYYNKNVPYSKSRQTTHPHQLHLEFLSETGIFGFIFLAFMVISSIIAGSKNYIKSRNLYCLSSLLFFCASTLSILPTGSFFTTYGAAIFWINYGIFMAKNK